MRIPLHVAGRPINTVFDLLGRKENDLTYALGWALANVAAFSDALLADVYATDAGSVTSVELQRTGEDRGFTDVQVIAERGHLVIEAKRGWVLPTGAQLARYAPRISKDENPMLLALTECSPEYASRNLAAAAGGVPVKHRSWAQLVLLADRASATGSHANRRLLRELARYLRGVMTLQDVGSNMCFCVVLSRETPAGWTISLRDVVRVHNKYFHPYGGNRGWPKRPPNYMAFRWNGAVERVQHVDDYRVVDDLSEMFSEIPRGSTTEPHVVYDLGPEIPMRAPLRSGTNYRAARLWVALDLLLTSDTLRDAIELTRRRAHARGAD